MYAVLIQSDKHNQYEQTLIGPHQVLADAKLAANRLAESHDYYRVVVVSCEPCFVCEYAPLPPSAPSSALAQSLASSLIQALDLDAALAPAPAP